MRGEQGCSPFLFCGLGVVCVWLGVVAVVEGVGGGGCGVSVGNFTAKKYMRDCGEKFGAREVCFLMICLLFRGNASWWSF